MADSGKARKDDRMKSVITVRVDDDLRKEMEELAEEGINWSQVIRRFLRTKVDEQKNVEGQSLRPSDLRLVIG